MFVESVDLCRNLDLGCCVIFARELVRSRGGERPCTTSATMRMLLSSVLWYCLYLAAAISPSVCVDSRSYAPYRSLGEISVKDPSFVRVLACRGGPPSLWITTFAALSAGEVLTVFNLSSDYPDFSNAKTRLLSSAFKWPNIISIAPEEIGEYLVVPEGFLVPLKQTGALYLLKINCTGTTTPLNSEPIEITTPKRYYFYHMVVWRDMNGDGLLDIVTARVNDPILFGKPSGQLLWLEQPTSNPLDNVPWAEHSLADGPETVFVLTDLNPSDDQYEVFAA